MLPDWTDRSTSQFGFSFLSAGLGELIRVEDGRVKFIASGLLARFKRDFDGIEVARLKRCPICRAFYYATRSNKGACNEHLGLARIRRLREKIPVPRIEKGKSNIAPTAKFSDAMRQRYAAEGIKRK